jgi:predicted RND superfamily exporter protein
MTGLKKAEEIDLVVSINDLKKLEKDTVAQKFQLVSLIDATQTSHLDYLKKVKEELFERLPFYEGLLFNKESGSIRSALYLKKNIVNTEARKTFILKNLVPKVEKFEKETGIDLRVSGMPYIRTINAENMKGEIGLFIGAALFITSFIFFLFFRSFRATFISISILLLGVVWSFGTLGLFRYKITILTAIIPPLIIVIGICNCIFLINKYQQEIKIHKKQDDTIMIYKDSIVYLDKIIEVNKANINKLKEKHDKVYYIVTQYSNAQLDSFFTNRYGH